MTLAASILGILLVVSTAAAVMITGAEWPFDLYLLVILSVCGVLAALLIWIVSVAVGHRFAGGADEKI